MRRLLALAAVPLLAAGCGVGKEASERPPTTATTAATTTVAAPATSTAVVYFLHDGKVAPVRVEVPETRAVATAALHALLAGPPAGYETELPAGGRLLSLSIDAGVATAKLSDELGSLDAAAEAQLVYTLTRFGTVTGVRTLPRPLVGGDGMPLTEPATRADFEAETPAILVESPLPGDEVASPLRVTGTANAFEATFQLELRRGGEALVHRTVTATSGSGERGTFDTTLEARGSGRATLVAWEDNMGEGAPVLHRVEVPISLR